MGLDEASMETQDKNGIGFYKEPWYTGNAKYPCKSSYTEKTQPGFSSSVVFLYCGCF